MTTGDDLAREMWAELNGKIDRLRVGVFGDERMPTNGGLYGQLKRIEEGMRASEARRDEQIQRLEERLDAMDKRLRPRWWDYIIMTGGAAILVMLILQVLTLLGHIG